ncbi:MAG: serine/threonine-protein phosphatase, partial [bacterium]|nr:serine/threonine-protein phosphatase [bacterium]
VSVPGIDAWVYSRPVGGQSSGGDIHYVSTCGGGQIARFAVADVSGHGVAVSELATQLRKLMRVHINTVDQTRFIRMLNRAFTALASDGKFATALLTTYFAPTAHLITCNAGHPPPLWYRSADQTWRSLEHTCDECVKDLSNLPLGVISPTRYSQFAVPVERDDLVLIHTDSLTESRSPGGAQLGQSGLLDLARRFDAQAPAEFCGALLDAVSDFRGGVAAEDDVTLMLLHANGDAPPRQSLGEMIRVVGKMLHLLKV